MIRIHFILLVALLLTVSFSSSADAKQYKKVVNGREVVVHTNPIPVVLHRMVPPQHGRHVTQREVSESKVPSSGRPVVSRGR